MANGCDHTVAITFDDAFLNVKENAVPILKRHNLPAGIFVPAGNLGQLPRWNIPDGHCDKNETVMNQEQIAELHKDGFEIFSHGFSHAPLTEIDDGELEAELKRSREALQEIVGQETIGISYPHGAYDNRVCSAVQKANYKLGFTIEPSVIDGLTDTLRIGRVSVSPNDSLIKFKLKISGAYRVIRYIKSSKQLIA